MMKTPKQILDEFNLHPIPTEEEIIGSWSISSCDPVVSIICTTYNHESYIEDAIKGFLIQKTSFPFEIIIHDDASTDKTADVVKRFAKKYPRLIKTILQEVNQFSLGKKNTVVATRLALGKYIALCEGDDHWVVSSKLQKQYEVAIKYKNEVLVVSPGIIYNVQEKKLDWFCFHGVSEKKIDAQEVLNISGQFAPTASYFINKELLLNAREVFYDIPVGDLFIEVYAGAKAEIIYHSEVGSVYKYMTEGSWSERMSEKIIDNQRTMLRRMKKAVEKAEKDSDFPILDWSLKYLTGHFIIACEYLKNKEYASFQKEMKICFKYGLRNKRHYLYYYLRFYPSLIRLVEAARW